MIRSTGLYFKLSRIHEHADSVAEALTEMGLSGTVVVDIQCNVQVRIMLAGCQSGRRVEENEEFFDFWEGEGMPWKRLSRALSWEVSVETVNLPKLPPTRPQREEGNMLFWSLRLLLIRCYANRALRIRLYVCTSVLLSLVLSGTLHSM